MNFILSLDLGYGIVTRKIRYGGIMMYKNRELQQRGMKSLDEIEEDLSLKKVIDNVIKLSNNLKKGERIIIEQIGIEYSATVIKLKEGHQNGFPYDASEGEVKSKYYFKLK